MFSILLKIILSVLTTYPSVEIIFVKPTLLKILFFSSYSAYDDLHVHVRFHFHVSFVIPYFQFDCIKIKVYVMYRGSSGYWLEKILDLGNQVGTRIDEKSC